MKGSDGSNAQRVAASLGVVPQSIRRAHSTFAELARALSVTARRGRCRVVTLEGAMGKDAFQDIESGPEVFEVQTLSEPRVPQVTSASDTKAGITALAPLVDLLVFVGGDGTARDVLDALVATDRRVPVVGIPAGVKMHSGVFATSPSSAAQLLATLVDGGLVAAHTASVKDIDEEALRRGAIGSVNYGELLVPTVGGYLQHVKSAGKEVEALVLLEIAAEVSECFADHGVLVVGPGSTCMAVKEGLLVGDGPEPPTLLGVDVIAGGKLLIKDASAVDLEALPATHPELTVFVSFSRGQGFILGRGNQQLSAQFLRDLPATALHVVSSRTKLETLDGRPLLIDSGADAIDKKFAGLRPIISGYQDRLLYLARPA